MIISKTPFRISLIGGGTDFPSYYKRYPGLVIGGTINKYSYVTARHLPNVFNYKHRIVWSKNEVVNNINQIKHPTVKGVFRFLKINKGLEIHYQGDLQKNSGLGTSSSFCVGLINSLMTLNNKKISNKELASKAIPNLCFAQSFLSCLKISSKTALKRTGLAGSPCLTPLSTLNSLLIRSNFTLAG